MPRPPLKVLHLDSGRGLRGGQRQLEWLVQGLSTRHTVEQKILARGKLLSRMEAAGLQTRALTSDAFTPAALLRAAPWADIIHAHDARTHTWAALLSPRKPLVVSRRVAFPPRRSPLSRWKYRRPTLYLAVSNFVAAQLTQSGVDPARIQVAPDGVPPPRNEPKFRRPEAPLRVTAIDSADPGKGSALANRACSLAGVRLTLSRDLDADFPRHDVFLYLSESEGLGSALLLAAFSKIPVIASRVGGIPEAVEDGVTGLLVDNEETSVASALQRLSADPELARNVAESAYTRAVRCFGVDIMVDRTYGAYRSILDP